jgi:hypothetical protein
MCGPFPHDKIPSLFASRLKALAERRAALIAEIKARFGG